MQTPTPPAHSSRQAESRGLRSYERRAYRLLSQLAVGGHLPRRFPVHWNAKGTMDLTTLFDKFHLGKVRIGPRWVNVEIDFKDDDRAAAWELYVELLTRTVTQPLPTGTGDEETALDSVHSLFPTTREILRRRGRGTVEFSRVAIPILNQIVRPFTARWHREFQSGALPDTKCQEFREQLAFLQTDLRKYNRLLAEIAGVEDLTNLEAGK